VASLAAGRQLKLQFLEHDGAVFLHDALVMRGNQQVEV